MSLHKTAAEAGVRQESTIQEGPSLDCGPGSLSRKSERMKLDEGRLEAQDSLPRYAAHATPNLHHRGEHPDRNYGALGMMDA
jgi:hypothetical protein